MRKDGRFMGIDGSIPEGQGIVMAHLNECHELLEMVRPLRWGFPGSDLPTVLFNTPLSVAEAVHG
jgi:hypothetical protein